MIKVYVMHISTANILEMVTANENLAITFK